mgnify:CR=1 FL=1
MSILEAAKSNAHYVPSFADTRRKLVTPSIAFGLGRWNRIARGVRLGSSRHAPSAAANVSAVAALGNAGARPAREPSELAAGIEVAEDHLNA